jgi:hypothetical protein
VERPIYGWYWAVDTSHRAEGAAQSGARQARAATAGERPPVNDLWGTSGPVWLEQLDLPRAYSTRIESIRDLVEVYDREIEMLEREIHRELKDHAGYEAIRWAAIEAVSNGRGRAQLKASLRTSRK